jgi:hypothetical protein
MDFDSVNLGGHDDLAGQSGRFPALVGEFQNNVTSGASALTAAIAIDTRHGVIGGSAHQVLANLGLNATAYTVKADEMNLGHGQKSFLKNQNSGIS